MLYNVDSTFSAMKERRFGHGKDISTGDSPAEISEAARLYLEQPLHRGSRSEKLDESKCGSS